MHNRTSGSAGVAWRVRVNAPTGDSRFSFLQVERVAATRTRPVFLIAGGMISTGKPTTALTTGGPRITSYGEVISFQEKSDRGAIRALLRTLGGEVYDIPNVIGKQRWYDLSPGVLGLTRTVRGATLVRHDGGAAKATWTRDLADPTIIDVTAAGWLPKGEVVIRVVHRRSAGSRPAVEPQQLLRLALATGAASPLAHTPIGKVAVSPKNATLAIAYQRDDAAGGSTRRVRVIELASGRTRADVEIPYKSGLPFPILPDEPYPTMGFDGTLVWFYDYAARRTSDMAGTTIPESCRYAVYDTSARGALVRTISDAKGEWARLSGGCRVRGLVPSGDGVIAFSVVSRRQAEAVKFDGPP